MARAVTEYNTFLRLAPKAQDASRVKKLLPAVKKKAAGGK